MPTQRVRNLIIVLGDQLSLESSAFDTCDKKRDMVWIAEVAEESTHVWTHKARIVLFLSGMRHFHASLIKKGFQVDYRSLDDRDNRGTLAKELLHAIEQYQPEKLIVTEPGEYRVRQSLTSVAREAGVTLEIRDDRHFLSSVSEFASFAESRTQLRLEFFYRELRKKTGILLQDGKPVGGKWNYDAENRKSFGKKGPQHLPEHFGHRPDPTTRQVIALVESHFSKHPGKLDNFDWPTTPQQARESLADFIEHRLSRFGETQDAMWTNQPYLFHSRLSTSLNLKLLDPRDVLRAVEGRYQDNQVSLAAAEGFIRQVLGWREYVRGVYWKWMPGYLQRNELDANRPLPNFYWTGQTEMNCLRQVIEQTLKFGYAHHIQRLMVTGLFALLLGVNPVQVHEWYLAVYVDAVEWVELPNTLGMSQYADGGIMASKPYCASGKYIQRMSNYCQGCRYEPGQRTGENACPVTTLYWDFLMRHSQRLADNQRMTMQLKNAERLSREERNAITRQADQLRISLV